MLPARRTLESWKAIADYVGRDVRTVMRWERDRGLPVRRLRGGKGSTVFADADEIDAWLLTPPPDAAAKDEALDRVNPQLEQPPAHPSVLPHKPAFLDVPRSEPRHSLPLLAVMAAAALLVGSFAFGRLLGLSAEQIMLVRFEGDRLIAASAAGDEIWSYRFGRPVGAVQRRAWTAEDIDNDGRNDVVAAVPFFEPSALGQAEDTLFAFSSTGRLKWRRTLAEQVTFGDQQYSAPWVGSSIVVYGPPSARAIAWSVHHYTWWPALILRITPDGTITNRFAHPGWLTDLSATRDGRWLIAGGANNGLDAAVTVVLDGARFSGAPAVDAGPQYACATCGPPEVEHYLVYPRSEVNRAGPFRIGVTASAIQPDGGVRVQVIQTDEEKDAATVIYELRSDFTLAHTSYSDSYWRWHDRLQLDGRLDHSGPDCPQRTPAAIERAIDNHQGTAAIRNP